MTTITADYTALASQKQVLEVAAAIRARGINVEIVDTAAEALEKITQLIPSGATIMTGASQTLLHIGLESKLIEKAHSWINLKDALLSEKDPVAQKDLRDKSIHAEYFLGSVHGISQTGEIVVGSGSGSQLPSYAYSSPNVIWVAGIQKIVPTLEEALRRLREYALPQEDIRMKGLGYPGAMITKTLIIEHEPAMLGRNVTLILVNESVGV